MDCKKVVGVHTITEKHNIKYNMWKQINVKATVLWNKLYIKLEQKTLP